MIKNKNFNKILYEALKKQKNQTNSDRMRNDPEADWVDVIRCKDCKHFHHDMPYVIQDFPVLGHDVCDFWGDGCKTSENGFCSFAEKEGEENE